VRKLAALAAAAGLVLGLSPALMAGAPPNLGGLSLAPGDSGPAVAVLQADLNSLGYHAGPDDGVYGPATRAAVRSFQASAGVAVDGLAGPQTLAALGEALTRTFHAVPGGIGSAPLTVGDTGPAVLTLQGDLLQLGYDPGVPDGVFGDATGRALMAFQRDHGLGTTEVLGPYTFAALKRALAGEGSGGTGGTGETGGTGGGGTSGGSGAGRGGGAPAQATPASGFVHLEFWARWSDDPAPLASLQAHARQIGILAPLWLTVTGGGGVQPQETAVDTAAVRSQVIGIAHAAGERVLVLVNDHGGAAAYLSTASGRGDLARQIASYVRSWGADGAMIDFEDIPQADRDELTAFAAALHGLTYTGISVPPKTRDVMGYWFQDAFDYAGLGRAVDLVQVMTYDDHGSWSGPGPVAPIGWVEQVANYAASRIDPHKVLLGIPSYGYDWSAAGATSVPDRDLASLAAAHGAIPTLDPASDELSFRYRDASGLQHTVWGLNAQGVADRVALARRLGLGGVAVWMLGDEPPGFWQAYRS
jgi:spore germination protein